MHKQWNLLDRSTPEETIEVLLALDTEIRTKKLSSVWSIESNWETFNAGIYGLTYPPEYPNIKTLMKKASRKRLKALELNCTIFAKFFGIFKENGTKDDFLLWYKTIQASISSVGKMEMHNATLHITDGFRENAIEFILELFEAIEKLNNENIRYEDYYARIGDYMNHIKILKIPLSIYIGLLPGYDRVGLRFQIQSYLEEERRKERILLAGFQCLKWGQPTSDLTFLLLSFLPPDRAETILMHGRTRQGDAANSPSENELR